jgi:two-component system, NtrC family, response regulator HydG
MNERSLAILIVDDDKDNAASLGELFELCGHNTTVVHSGEAAVHAFSQYRFDIAFMDVVMPDKNGVESFLEIKQLQPNAKVIMMTGYSVEQLLEEAVANGALGVISKPLGPEEALNVLECVGADGLVIAEPGGPSRSEIQSALENNGRRCIVIENESQANRIPIDEHDIVLVDINRPLIEAVGIVTKLQRSGYKSQTIVFPGIALSESAGSGFLRDFRVTGILSKPFDPNLLIDSIAEIAA